MSAAARLVLGSASTGLLDQIGSEVVFATLGHDAGKASRVLRDANIRDFLFGTLCATRWVRRRPGYVRRFFFYGACEVGARPRGPGDSVALRWVDNRGVSRERLRRVVAFKSFVHCGCGTTA